MGGWMNECTLIALKNNRKLNQMFELYLHTDTHLYNEWMNGWMNEWMNKCCLIALKYSKVRPNIRNIWLFL